MRGRSACCIVLLRWQSRSRPSATLRRSSLRIAEPRPLVSTAWISDCSKAPTAPRGRSRNRSWTRCTSPTDSKVADIGAGAGWFTIHLARRVGPNGIVYAQDVQREMLEAIKRRVQREGLQNVQTRRGEGSNPNLPAAGARRDRRRRCLSQEVEDRVTFLQNLARALKPNGRIGIVNWKPGAAGPALREDARVDKASVVEPMPRRADCGSSTTRRCRTNTCWSLAK